MSINIKDFYRSIKKKGSSVKTWHDKLSFFNIFLLWAIEIMTFSLIYFFSVSTNNYLFNAISNTRVTSFWDYIYFSFITATTTGFGDIIPFGAFKTLAIVEVVFAMLIMALVTSKLVSIKQNVILSEVYELSFNEKINRLRSSLLVFSQNLSRIINRIEDKSIRKREIFDLYIYVSSLEDTLGEISIMMNVGSVHNYYKKDIDPVNTELIFNNIIGAFEKLGELIVILNENRLEWKRKITVSIIEACLNANEELFKKLNTTYNNIPEKKLKDLNYQKSKILSIIKPELEEDVKKVVEDKEEYVKHKEELIQELRAVKGKEDEKEEEQIVNDNLAVDVNKILDPKEKKEDKKEKNVDKKNK